jgi:hypothetical protein
MSLITVTDTAGTSGSATIESFDLADTIRPWYPEAPAEVLAAVDELQDAVNSGVDQEGLTAYLALSITPAALLTVKLAESPGEYDTTHAVILDADGDEVADFGGPISEYWDETGWDAALLEAGYRRVGHWAVSEGTATVVPA